MKIFVDIDETICNTPLNRDYEKAVPIAENISLVNRLYDEDHEITMWTARGSVTGKDWRELTEHQLMEWGCKYHELKMGKPAYDVFIDDKALNSRVWEKKGNRIVKKVFVQSHAYQFATASVMGDDRYCWVLEGEFPGGLNINPCLVKIRNHSILQPNNDADVHWTPITVTFYDVDSDSECSNTISSVVEKYLMYKYNKKKELPDLWGNITLTAYDELKKPIESFVLKQAWFQAISTCFTEVGSLEDKFNIEIDIRFGECEYKDLKA